MNLRPSFRRLSAPLLAFLFIVAQASACPDCLLKNSGGIIEPQTVAAKLAFSASTLLLLGILFSALGFMIWTMVKTCRELSKERPLSSHGEL